MFAGISTALVLAWAVGCVGDRPAEDSAQEQSPTSRYELRAEDVPASLRHLVPLAEKWGIGDDVERGEFIEQASNSERQELMRALAPHQNAITAWLDSFESDPMTDEAAAFMYMQLAAEEMRSY